jgi:co-chaperonin GroES (HSP10)
MKLEALYNAVIVKPFEVEEITHGNIIVPDLGNEKNKLGKVVAVGDGYYSVTGAWIDTVLEVDDIVVLPTMGFSKLEHEGEEYWIGPENQVLARLSNETEVETEELPF